MEKLSDYVYKKTTKPGQGTEKIDINRNRITYHYNIYLEKADRPCDSTHLRGFPEVSIVGSSIDSWIYMYHILDTLYTSGTRCYCWNKGSNFLNG